MDRGPILEVVEPYWSSDYEIVEASEPAKPPFLAHRARGAMSHERWLSALARYLISTTAGPFRSVFLALRSLVKVGA